MDKSCQSSGESSITTATSNSGRSSTSGSRDEYLKHLNKLSHKISKPILKKPPQPPFDHHTPLTNHSFNHQPPQPQPQPQPPVAPSVSQPQTQPQNLQAQPQHQPPVYNINKNDFRDVVQKLTGSPAHERFSSSSSPTAPPPPPPIHHPKPASSRLQRIRPPPLAQISNRPPPLLNSVVQPPLPLHPAAAAFGGVGRPAGPLSPLPPLPAVHAAAESPVSAYMRFLQNSMSSSVDTNQKQPSGFSPLAPLVSPRWSNFAPPPPQQQGVLPPPQATSMMPPPPPPQFQVPPSPPIPFGCLNSPRSPYPLLSPSLLLSPSSGQLGFPQLPLSPTVPVPSPRWRGF